MHREDLVGTWLLESFTAKSSGGAEVLPLGELPQGVLIYTEDGHMSAVVMASGRPRFASGDLRSGTPDEIKQAFEGFDAYAGTYEMDQESGTITHRAQVARFPNWEGTAQVRYAKVVDGKLHLATPPVRAVGQDWIATLAWRRACVR